MDVGLWSRWTQRSPFATRAVQTVKRWGRLTLGLVLPATCAFCRRAIDSDDVSPQLCPACVAQFVNPSPTCERCGAVLRDDALQSAAKAKQGCPQCRGQQFAFDSAFCLGSYEGSLAEAVLRMKYAPGQPLAYALGRQLARRIGIANCQDWFDLVTCTPKYWAKRLITGVNSPEVIMQGLAADAKLPFAADLLNCRRKIEKQSSLSVRRRQQNVKNAWMASGKYQLNDARILLVDDILTTGATADSMAKALKQHGACQVSIAVVGRATR